ncbi:MAG: tryptophan synthase subunit alpha [Spirochaetia bacterium]|jgi:tryptophan synthase alpha chain|nr:tryptophan synthase subunit alpha [Spirochaetia bacterium]
MSRVSNAFGKGKAFIPFITVGDPDIETTEKLVYALEEAGSDLIELGIPFSDPTAEGPVIMAASRRALEGGVTTDAVFALVERIRKKSSIPLAFMTYANVIFSYGIERFATKAGEAGVDALILPDVPFEERKEFSSAFQAHDIDLISMIAPTSADRVKKIAKEATGFIYCVSSLGVTGTRNTLSSDIGALIKQVRNVRPDIPCAIGFGIGNAGQASKMAALSDGIIVGSAIVKLIADQGKDCVPAVLDFAKELKIAAQEGAK